MGYAFYEIPHPITGRMMKRGYGVRCKCHKRGCQDRIDRGLAYLCYRCTWYFCYKHLTFALSVEDEWIEAECFAGKSIQVCHRCADAMEQEQRVAAVGDGAGREETP